VDKVNFLHRVNGLARFLCAEQALYPDCTEGVQISRVRQKSGFCTFAPVDMHVFVHSRLAAKSCLSPRQGLAGRERRCDQAGKRPMRSAMPVLTLAANSSGRRKKKFCKPAAFAYSGLQPK
jgi:hypothetical protein